MSEEVILENLKAGDYVKTRSHFHKHFFVTKIDRETRTQFVIGFERYAKLDGARLGDKTYYSRAWIVTGPEGVVTEQEKVACDARIAENKRLDAAREHTEHVKERVIDGTATDFGVPRERIKVESQTDDGFVTVTYKVVIDNLTEAELVSLGLLA